MSPQASAVLGLWNWTSPAWIAAGAASFLYLRTHKANKTAGIRPLLFAASMVAFLLATVSPIATLSNGYLFSVHMVHHILLLLVAPGLLLLSIDPEVARRALGRSATLNRVASFLGKPVVGWISGIGAMGFWHLPTLCSLSQQSSAVYQVQTVSLLLMGTAFWMPVLSPVAERRLHALQGVAYLFSSCLACTLIGIYLTFSPANVCPAFAHGADPLGLRGWIRNDLGFTPQADQQVGGLLMWVPACFVYLSGVFVLFYQWYYGKPQTEAAISTAKSA